MAKKLLCLNYPGIVNNVDNMLTTVGGMDGLTKTYNEDGARLELRFRPDDVYSHSAFGDRISSHGLLVKCIRRKKVVNGQAICSYETTVVGVIDTFYRFQSMADFQYLPVAKVDNQPGKPTYKSLIDDILPANPFSGISKTFNPNAPLFVLPTIFSRFDSPSDYHYRDDPRKRPGKERRSLLEPSEMNFIGRTRKSRSVIVCMISWTEPCPMEPSEAVLSYATGNAVNEKYLEPTKLLFQSKPIWSRNALLYELNCTKSDLKHVLPCVAYYFYNGPFRRTWIRYGYDPRVDKNAKIFQSLDFRVKQTHRNRLLAKRSIYQYQLPLKKNDADKYRNRYRASVIEQDSFGPSTSQSSAQRQDERSKKLYAAFTFEPGLMPAYRQISYQLCDIKVEKVQELVHSNDRNEPEVCDERDGWCVPGAIDQIRSILLSIMDDMLAREQSSSTISRCDDMEYEEFSEDEYLEYSSDVLVQ